MVEVIPDRLLRLSCAYPCDRDENTKRPLPRRLQELVAQYPYTTSPDQTADGLLTRPRFSTRRYDALFVRVEAVYPDVASSPSSRSPVGVFTDALESEPKSGSGGYLYLWNQVKAAATSDSDDKPLPTILSDDTINLLSLTSTDPKEQVLLGIPCAAPTLVSPLSPTTETPSSPTANGNGAPVPVHKPTLPSNPPQSPKDWAEFSSAGFGETTISQNFASTLLDKDVEVTEPPIHRKPSKQRQNKNTVAPVEPTPPVADPKPAPEEPEGPKLILVATEVVQLDEAFIDFWRDAVVDPISNNWPKFVVGELKNPLVPRSTSASSEGGERVTPGSPIHWIIIEQKFRRPTPPPTPVIPHETSATSSGLKVPAVPLKRTSSPRPSFGDKKSSSLSATLKRFTIFGSSKDDLTPEDTSPAVGGSGKKDSFAGRKKFGVSQSPKIGEMGETGLSEEPEPQPEVPKKVDEPSKVVTVDAAVVGGALLATTAGGDKGAPAKEDTKEEASTKDDELPAPPEDGPPADEGKPEDHVPSNPKALPPTPDIIAPEETTPISPTLPHAPESVVSHGETPGPQLALDSTEVGMHHALDVEESQVTVAELAVPSPEPVVEHLEDRVEDSAADVGVDLDPVPIIPNDPVQVQEVEEPNVAPEPPVTSDEKAEESTTEDVFPQPPAPVSEQEVEPTAPQPVVTEDVSPPLPSVSEELERGGIASTQPVLSGAQSTDVPPTPEPDTSDTTDIVSEDVPTVQTVLDG